MGHSTENPARLFRPLLAPLVFPSRRGKCRTARGDRKTVDPVAALVVETGDDEDKDETVIMNVDNACGNRRIRHLHASS